MILRFRIHSVSFLKIGHTQELRLSKKWLFLRVLLEKAELIITRKSGKLMVHPDLKFCDSMNFEFV